MIRWVFLAVMLLLAATLGWLGWRFLQQDQQLADQRLAEQRESAAEIAVASLERRLVAIDQDLSAAQHAPVDGAMNQLNNLVKRASG